MSFIPKRGAITFRQPSYTYHKTGEWSQTPRSTRLLMSRRSQRHFCVGFPIVWRTARSGRTNKETWAPPAFNHLHSTATHNNNNNKITNMGQNSQLEAQMLCTNKIRQGLQIMKWNSFSLRISPKLCELVR